MREGNSLLLQLSKGSIMTNKGCILVVDETPADLEMLADTLTMEGYQVLSAASGVLALAAVAARLDRLDAARASLGSSQAMQL